MKFSLLFAALPLLACSPEDKVPEYESRLSQAVCDFGLSCNAYDTAESGIVAALRTVSPAACESFVDRYLFAEDRDGDLLRGEFKLDEDALDACIARAEASCDLQALMACRAVEGRVALGGACTSSDDCAGDAFCTDACGGVCTARVALGAACTSDDECTGVDVKCNYESETCMAVTRIANVAEGGACDEQHTADKVTISRCASGLACYAEVCTAIVAKGGTCDDDHTPCELGTICMPETEDAASGTCVPQPFTVGAGQACDALGTFVSSARFCNIAENLGCFDGTCLLLGDGSVGSRCLNLDLAGGECDDGNACDEATNTCQPVEVDVCQ